jgi:hypothetical protein
MVNAKKRQREDEKVSAFDGSLSGMRCVSLEDVADGGLVTALARRGSGVKDVLVVAESASRLLSAAEGVDGCSVSWSSRWEGKRAGEEAGVQWLVLAFSSVKAANDFVRARPSAASGEEEGGRAHAGGLRAWLANHRAAAVDPRALQASVDGYMAAFDAGEELVGTAETELEARMRADGFVLIPPRKGAKRATPGPLSDNQKRKIKRGSLQLDDFYRHQVVGSKVNALTELRSRFDADKIKVRELKEARTFKPY